MSLKGATEADLNDIIIVHTNQRENRSNGANRTDRMTKLNSLKKQFI
jgi:hypothetical protein